METITSKSVKTENKQIEYVAFHIANSIDIAAYKKNNERNLISATSTELYYKFDLDKYLLVLNYGLIVMANYLEKEKNIEIKKTLLFGKEKVLRTISDNLSIIIRKDIAHFEMTFDFLSIGRFDHSINKAIMLNLAQSVCLDYYTELSQQLLLEIKSSTVILGDSGHIKLKHKEALRLAGRSLAAKNSIAENLYILDSPDTSWEDEYIDKIHKTLSRHFELSRRYQSIENTFKIIEDNLNLYIAYNHHRESSRLEWIIIILIVIEVLDTLLSKLF